MHQGRNPTLAPSPHCPHSKAASLHLIWMEIRVKKKKKKQINKCEAVTWTVVFEFLEIPLTTWHHLLVKRPLVSLLFMYCWRRHLQESRRQCGLGLLLHLHLLCSCLWRLLCLSEAENLQVQAVVRCWVSGCELYSSSFICYERWTRKWCTQKEWCLKFYLWFSETFGSWRMQPSAAQTHREVMTKANSLYTMSWSRWSFSRDSTLIQCHFEVVTVIDWWCLLLQVDFLMGLNHWIDGWWEDKFSQSQLMSSMAHSFPINRLWYL